MLYWLRELDLNQRPSGYEPDELPGQAIEKFARILLSVHLWAGNWAEIDGRFLCGRYENRKEPLFSPLFLLHFLQESLEIF